MPVTITLSGNESQLVGAINRASRALQQMGEEHARSAKAGNQAVIEGLRGLDQMAARYVSITAAIGLATKMAMDFIQIQKQAAQEAAAAAPPLAELTVLAAGNRAETARLIQLSKDLSVATGIQPAQTPQFVGQLMQAGVTKWSEQVQIGRLYPSFAKPGEMAISASALQHAMGATETGTIPDIIGKAIAAARPGTAIGRPEEILAAVAKGGTMAGQLGWTDEQVFAVVAEVSKHVGGAEPAGVGVDLLLRSLVKRKQFQGLGFTETIKLLSSMEAPADVVLEEIKQRPGVSTKLLDLIRQWETKGYQGKTVGPEQLLDLIATRGARYGGAELVGETRGRPMTDAERYTLVGGRPAAYEALIRTQQGYGDILKTIDRLQAVGGAEMLDTFIRTREEQPDMAAFVQSEKDKAKAEIGLRQRGIVTQVAEAARQRIRKFGFQREGESGLSAWMDAKTYIDLWMEGPEQFLRNYGTADELVAAGLEDRPVPRQRIFDKSLGPGGIGYVGWRDVRDDEIRRVTKAVEKMPQKPTLLRHPDEDR